MKKIISSSLFLFFLSGTIVLAIEPDPEHSGYWRYEDRPVLLLGASSPDHPFFWAYSDRWELLRRLDHLQAIGGNYMRSNLGYEDQNEHSTLDPKYRNKPRPFKRPANGLYDLNQWNEAFWEAFDFYLKETKKRDIIVNQELWDYCHYLKQDWPTDPWNPKNNVNYTEAESGLKSNGTDHHLGYTDNDGFFRRYYTEFFDCVPTMENRRILYDYQDKYIKKLLSYTLKYDHVIYQYNNESSFHPALSKWWHDILMGEAAARGKMVYIGDQRYQQDLRSREYQYVIDHNDLNAWVGPANMAIGPGYWTRIQELRYRAAKNGVPMQFQKLYPFWAVWPHRYQRTNTWIMPYRQNQRRRFWIGILSQCAGVRYHREYLYVNSDYGNGEFTQPPHAVDFGIHPEVEDTIVAARRLTDFVNQEDDFFALQPNMCVLDDVQYDLYVETASPQGGAFRTTKEFHMGYREAYAMTEVGRQYLIYFSGIGDGKVSLDLRAVNGTMNVRWINARTGAWQPATSLQGGRWRTISTPERGEWACYLWGGSYKGDPGYPAGKQRIVGFISGMCREADLGYKAFDDDTSTCFRNYTSRERWYPLKDQAFLLCDLGRVKEITEVNLRMLNGDTTSYPIEILIDDVPFWSGRTKMTSDAASYPIGNATGRFVNVVMIGENTSGNWDFGVVEIEIIGSGTLSRQRR